MNESLIVTLLYLFNTPKYRCYLRRGIGLEVFFSYLYFLSVFAQCRFRGEVRYFALLEFIPLSSYVIFQPMFGLPFTIQIYTELPLLNLRQYTCLSLLPPLYYVFADNILLLIPFHRQSWLHLLTFIIATILIFQRALFCKWNPLLVRAVLLFKAPNYVIIWNY